MFRILTVVAVLWMRACQHASIVYSKGMQWVACKSYLDKFAKHMEEKESGWTEEDGACREKHENKGTEA